MTYEQKVSDPVSYRPGKVCDTYLVSLGICTKLLAYVRTSLPALPVSKNN